MPARKDIVEPEQIEALRTCLGSVDGLADNGPPEVGGHHTPEPSFIQNGNCQFSASSQLRGAAVSK